MDQPTSMETLDITVETADARLPGFLNLPDRCSGLVLFAHGSGSSRFSTRNHAVARFLNQSGLATLLFDLLTEDEQAVDSVTAELRFDIDLISRRLTQALDWAAGQQATGDRPLGLFGASTGAAAAIRAAADRPDRVAAVVSRGGRPDLAGEALTRIVAPSLFIVGGLDTQVIELNEQAAAKMMVKPRLEIVPGATHLFQEPGTLDAVSRLAADWFDAQFTGRTRG